VRQMIISTNIQNKDLERISDLIKKGKANNIHEFIRYAILNQLELEETHKEKESIIIPQVVKEQSKTRFSVENAPKVKRQSIDDVDLSACNVQKSVVLNINSIKSRTVYPIWSMKNRYFPTKYALRVIQKLVKEDQKNHVSLERLYDEINASVFNFRKKLEFVDKLSENKRGNRITAGFPNEKKPQSMTRFLRNFVVTISPDGKTVSGLLYDIGFVDVREKKISITQYGNEFANIKSPIIDQKTESIGRRSTPLSNEEIEFLVSHVIRSTNSESSLMFYMLRKLAEKNLVPDELNDRMFDYLTHEYKGDKNYSNDVAKSMRVGLTSRMVEIGLIKNIRKDGGSFYQITKHGKKILEGG